MTDRAIRTSVLTFLDSLPDDESVHPAELASQLGLPADQLNPYLNSANDEDISTHDDGSITIGPRLKGQFRKSTNTPTPVPTHGWNAAQPWQKGLVLICSVIFLCVLCYAALRSDPIGDRQFVILRTILALAGAGFTIGIPGFIEVEISIRTNLLLRAMGAVAVFAVIYFFVPAI